MKGAMTNKHKQNSISCNHNKYLYISSSSFFIIIIIFCVVFPFLFSNSNRNEQRAPERRRGTALFVSHQNSADLFNEYEARERRGEGETGGGRDGGRKEKCFVPEVESPLRRSS